MPDLFISVIIPTCNRPEMLAACLDLLDPEVQFLPQDTYEVIVTDDSHGNDTFDMLEGRYPRVLYTRGPRRGPAANRNHGASLAKGEWLAFTDDDCLPQPGWLKAYVRAIEHHPECRAFEGRILPTDEAALKKDLAECPVNRNGGCFWSANILVEAALFRNVGGMDEAFLIPAQEDQDLYIRLQEHTEIPFIPEAVIDHPVRKLPFWQAIKQEGRRFENYMVYARKHAARLGMSSERQILWQKGVKFQAHASWDQFRQGQFISCIVSLYSCVRYSIRYARRLPDSVKNWSLPLPVKNET